MKSRVLFLLAFVVSNVNVSAQNLVPNGSFEEGSECPMFLDDLHFRCNDWYKCIQVPGVPMNENPSPDWYHACTEQPLLSTPDFVFGYQVPFTGSGYAAFVTFSSTEENYREIIGIQLTEPLSPNTTYTVKFKVVAEAQEPPTGLVSDNIGFKFSMNSIYLDSDEIIDNTSHGFVASILSDTLNWDEISFEFTANEPFEYLHIGNFYDDSSTNIIDLAPGNANGAYYLIDDVSVSPSTLSSSDDHGFIEIGVFPNPATSTLYFSNSELRSKIISIRINDALGREIRLSRYTSDYIDIGALESGLYFIQFVLDNGELSKSKFYKI